MLQEDVKMPLQPCLTTRFTRRLKNKNRHCRWQWR